MLCKMWPDLCKRSLALQSAANLYLPKLDYKNKGKKKRTAEMILSDVLRETVKVPNV